MAKTEKEKYFEAARRMKLSEQEIKDMWDYDQNYTANDKQAAAYFKEHFSDLYTNKEIDQLFGLEEKEDGPTQAQLAQEHARKVAASNEVRAERMAYLKEALKEKSLWGEPVEETNNTLKYFDAKDGKHHSVKLGRHKVQQVTARPLPDKKARDRRHDRAEQLHDVVIAKPELFEAVDWSIFKISFVERDNPTYSFGSLAITHHKN